MKQCQLCGETKPLDEFHRRSKSPDGHQSRCKACAIAVARQSYVEHREERGVLAKRWAAANVELVRRVKHNHLLRRKYGITLEEYERRLADQGGGCAICGSSDPAPFRWFHVDHDHGCCPGKITCGRCIRGLLCNGCNRAIGCFREDVVLLGAALEYLSDQRLVRASACRICGSTDPQRRGSTRMCEKSRTGRKVAGICYRCNTGLGQFRDRPTSLEAAMLYLGGQP